MHLSLATMADLPRVMDLVEGAKIFMHQHNNFQWDDEYPLQDTFRTDIEKKHLYVYREKELIEAFICINEDIPHEYLQLKWQTTQPCLVIHRMVTNTHHMGKGLAYKMMCFAIEKAQNEGIYSIWTDTNSKNGVMMHLFDKLGFTFVGNIVLRDKPDIFCCYELAVGNK